VKILFDQGTPTPLKRYLPGHTIDLVYGKGWATFTNGALLHVAENADYDLFITTDQNLRYQQNLAARRVSVLVLQTTSWPRIKKQIAKVQAAVNSTTVGSYQELSFDSKL